MSEHFLGSSKAFEILANLGLDPLWLRREGLVKAEQQLRRCCGGDGWLLHTAIFEL